jgi:hypothetical protein
MKSSGNEFFLVTILLGICSLARKKRNSKREEERRQTPGNRRQEPVKERETEEEKITGPGPRTPGTEESPESNPEPRTSSTGKKVDKKNYVKGWSDEKVLEVWEGRKKGEYELGEDDLEILGSELKRRKIGPYSEEDELEQVPIGYIRLYPETPERNEFYKKRYFNAKKAWPDTRIIQKGDTWFIVAKGESETGYDVHLFFTNKKTEVHGTCTCADYSQRGVRRNFPCKHIFMVLIHTGLTAKWPEID